MLFLFAPPVFYVYAVFAIMFMIGKFFYELYIFIKKKE